MEDSHLRRLWRLTDILMMIRQGVLTPKSTKNEGRSGNVHENKGANDKVPEEKPDIITESTEFLQKKAAL
jgi:hypothetical protein